MSKTDSYLTKLRLDQIKPGINPRTEFSQPEMEELAQSMKDDGGAVQSLVVYLDDDGIYGLIAGERRWRAAQIAGLESVEAVVKPKPLPHQARKMALKENLCRADLTPLEIARAVSEQLKETDGVGIALYTRTQLAEELGKDVKFVLRCEALLRCSTRLQARVHRRQADLEIAAQIGAQPSELHTWLEDQIVFCTPPLTREKAREFIGEKVRRYLNKAQFDREDASLVPGRPACKDCEFWGGNREDVAGRCKGNVCLNPVCFDSKQAAYVASTLSASDEGVGVQMLGQEMRSKIFGFDNVTTKGDCGWVRSDAYPDGDLLVNPRERTEAGTWAEILQGLTVPMARIQDAEGALVTLYDAKLALEAARSAQCKARSRFKGGAPADEAETVQKAAQDKAKALARVEAGKHWLAKISSGDGALRLVIESTVKLVCLRLTEPADREWMTQVTGKKEPCSEGSMEALALALVARSIRLEGPKGITAVAGELAELVGYDVKSEAKAAEQLAVQLTAKASAPAAEDDKPPRSKLGMWELSQPQPEAKAETVDARPYAEQWSGYYCDGCGKVCLVHEMHYAEVEAMREGQFLGNCCYHFSRFGHFGDDLQAQYETWVPPARAARIAQDEEDNPALAIINQRRRAKGLPPETMEQARAQIAANIETMVGENADATEDDAFIESIEEDLDEEDEA